MDSIFFSALADIFLFVKFSHLSIQIFFFFSLKKKEALWILHIIVISVHNYECVDIFLFQIQNWNLEVWILQTILLN